MWYKLSEIDEAKLRKDVTHLVGACPELQCPDAQELPVELMRLPQAGELGCFVSRWPPVVSCGILDAFQPSCTRC
jgi:hypothetical protein